jgi:hypothetical protein
LLWLAVLSDDEPGPSNDLAHVDQDFVLDGMRTPHTLPDKFARFLFEIHSVRFESLDLPILPDDRSQYDVHSALEDDNVKKSEYTANAYDVHDNCYDYITYINYSYYVD